MGCGVKFPDQPITLEDSGKKSTKTNRFLKHPLGMNLWKSRMIPFLKEKKTEKAKINTFFSFRGYFQAHPRLPATTFLPNRIPPAAWSWQVAHRRMRCDPVDQWSHVVDNIWRNVSYETCWTPKNWTKCYSYGKTCWAKRQLNSNIWYCLEVSIQKKFRGAVKFKSHFTPSGPQDPWDWYIYLYLVDFFPVKVGKYSIHGSYGA